jgi:hypothetical protein
MSATSDDAVAAEALARGFVDAARLEQARQRLALLRQAGLGGDLLGALAPGLAPAQLAALRGIAAAAQGAGPGRTRVDAATTLAPVARQPDSPPAAPGLLGRLVAGVSGPLRPGERLGPYVVLRELGRGGMGVVYEAQHQELGRPVALKLRLPGDDKTDRRFLIEAQAAARLRHPNVVAVHDAGKDGGRLWMSMDLVEGESLEQRLARGERLDVEEAARLGAAVARALQHAHERGVLHRDLKPANILVRADGTPLVADFGLAKVVAGAESLTRTGELLGTPAYMPPEQANGVDGDARGDVWSVGATLYHLVSGQPPFQGDGLMALLGAVLAARFAPLSSVRPDVPEAFEAVVARCLQKDPAARYASAGALADDLERFLRDGRTEAQGLTARRGQRALALAVAAAFALPFLLGGAVQLARWFVPDRPEFVPHAGPQVAAIQTAAIQTAASEPPRERPARPVVEAAAPAERPEDAFVSRGGLWLPVRVAAAARPPARWSHAMVWDPRRRVVVVLGGRDKTTLLDDQWTWDGVAWRDETPRARPPGRFGAAAAYDEARGRLVLQGGATVAADKPNLGDLWEFDGERWTQVDADGGPGVRAYHGMAYDPAGRRAVLFGGADGRWAAHGDLWSWDGRAWAALPAGAAPAPSPRHLFGLTWDARRDVLVVYGAQGGAVMAEHWEWGQARGWMRRGDFVDGPGKKNGPALVAYPEGVVLNGGFDDRRYTSTTWTFDGERWSQVGEGLDPTLTLAPRCWHGMAFDAARGKVVLFGGETRRVALNDLWELAP